MATPELFPVDSNPTPPEPARAPLVTRPYQEAAKRAIYKSLREHRSTLLVLPTGTGKTVVFADVVGDGVRKGRRVLILAHRAELIEQGAKKIAEVAGCEVGIEMADQRDGSRGAAPVLMASVQSIVRRLAHFERDAFHLVIVDEAHHAAALTYRSILEHFGAAKVLGVTATPNRGDNVALRAVFDDVAFDLPLLDAIQDGWLVPIRQRVIETSIDLSACRRSKGDFTKKDLEDVMTTIEALHEIAVPTVEAVGERQAIVFSVTVAHAHLLAEAIRVAIADAGGTPRVEVVTGTTDDDERRDIFAGFRAGAVQYLVNVEVATEGTDLPSAQVIVMARPTQSRGLFCQMLGRGTRPLPGVVDGLETAAERRDAIEASGKPHMLLLDFAANTGKHDLASGVDALEGDELDDALAKDVREILATGEQDLIEAIRLARARRSEKTRAMRARGGDPFALFGMPEPEPDRWGRTITDEQAAVLRRSGIPISKLDRRQASTTIAMIVDRSARSLATYKQCRALHKFGCPLDVVETMPRKRAGELVTMLADGKWERPSSKYWWGAAPAESAPPVESGP
jgi:superfamily II DNA or RNA helicase